MALTPSDSKHALQIQAGILGRNMGHDFEAELALLINQLSCPIFKGSTSSCLVYGSPELALVNLGLQFLQWEKCDGVEAIALGSLATATEGKKWLEVRGVRVKACKSDLLLTLSNNGQVETVGVSVKQCNNKTPTNAQLYFTTARAFCNLLTNNGIELSVNAILAMRQFCGDEGFRPMDDSRILEGRRCDPRRFFWEEIDPIGKGEWQNILSTKNGEITKMLLQKAYLNDPFIPQLMLHKTRDVRSGPQEFALYTIDDLTVRSMKYGGFAVKPYSVRKGQYKDPAGIRHEAPRFGVVQMQRGGQKQHPTQLQFNLQAGYFYVI